MEAALGFDRYDSNFLPLTQYHGGNGNLVSLAPDHTQLPSTEDFTDILNEYINDLSPKKQDKALIPQKRLNNIEAVLRDPKCTTIESAQFRFWAKKMFSLQVDENGVERVMHENKPVAVREKLYRVLTTAHIQAQHGGRDKTSSQVRKSYSWVPKELIARFVRSCPNCRARRCPAQNRGYTSRARTTPPRAGVTVSSITMHAHRVQHSLTVQNAQNPQTASHFAYSDPVSMQHPGNQYSQWAQ
ncbi:hypothetical protein BDD12DRAFT_733835 [Trichophaea hybrida]|nr:hypothetical protein BDD12DRAFT_733835 [Trichophaea hybrida]